VSGNVGNHPGAKALKLHLTFAEPTGAVAAEKLMDWHGSEQSVSVVEGTTISAH